jgi:hypothetical protein
MFKSKQYIPLKRFENINIESELAFFIWSCEIRIMAKKRKSKVNVIVIFFIIKNQEIRVK